METAGHHICIYHVTLIGLAQEFNLHLPLQCKSEFPTREKLNSSAIICVRMVYPKHKEAHRERERERENKKQMKEKEQQHKGKTLLPQRGGTNLGVCSYMAGHEDAWVMTGHIGTNTPKFVPPRWGRPPFDPTQTGLCKFGWVWSSLNLPKISVLQGKGFRVAKGELMKQGFARNKSKQTNFSASSKPTRICPARFQEVKRQAVQREGQNLGVFVPTWLALPGVRLQICVF